MVKITVPVTDFECQLFESLKDHPMTRALQLSLEQLAERDITPHDKAFRQIVAEIGEKFPAVHFFRSNFGRMMNVYMLHADMDDLMVWVSDPELQAIMEDAYPQRSPKFFKFALGDQSERGYLAIMDYWFGTEKLPIPEDRNARMANQNRRAVQMLYLFKDQLCRHYPYTSVTNYSESVGVNTSFPTLDEAVKAIVRDVEIYEKIGRGTFTKEHLFQEMHEITYCESWFSLRRSLYAGRTYRVRYDKAPLDSAKIRANMDPGFDDMFEMAVVIDEITPKRSGQETRRVEHGSKEFSHVFDKAILKGVFAEMGPSPFRIIPIDPFL